MSEKFDNIQNLDENLEEILASLSEEELQDVLRQAEEMAMEDGEIDNIIVLNDEDGNEAEFEYLDIIAYEGEQYVVLLPCDDEDQMVVILRIEETDGEGETYASVEDDETLQAVFEIFKERAKDLFNFED